MPVKNILLLLIYFWLSTTCYCQQDTSWVNTYGFGTQKSEATYYWIQKRVVQEKKNQLPDLKAGNASSLILDKNNQPTDTAFIYNKKNELQYFKLFKNGKLHGESISFSSKGLVDHKSTYKDDQLSGTDSAWYQNGQLQYAGMNEKDHKTGKWRYFLPDENKRIEANLTGNYLDGTYTIFKKDTVMATGNFTKGVLVNWKTFYSNGIVRKECNTSEQGSVEHWRTYDENAALRLVTFYQQGRPSGTWYVKNSRSQPSVELSFEQVHNNKNKEEGIADERKNKEKFYLNDNIQNLAEMIPSYYYVEEDELLLLADYNSTVSKGSVTHFYFNGNAEVVKQIEDGEIISQSIHFKTADASGAAPVLPEDLSFKNRIDDNVMEMVMEHASKRPVNNEVLFFMEPFDSLSDKTFILISIAENIKEKIWSNLLMVKTIAQKIASDIHLPSLYEFIAEEICKAASAKTIYP